MVYERIAAKRLYITDFKLISLYRYFFFFFFNILIASEQIQSDLKNN